MNAKRYPHQKWVLPDTVFPNGDKCFIVPIPDEPHYIAAFKGALFGMTRWYNWDADVNHTAKDVAGNMLDYYLSIVETNCAANQVPQYFLAQDLDDPNGNDLLIYDLSSENDLEFRVKSNFVSAILELPHIIERASLTFKLFDGGAVCGGLINTLRCRFEGYPGTPNNAVHWWDCGGTEHSISTADNPLNLFGIDCTKFYIESNFSFSFALTFNAVSPCIF